MLSTLCEHFLSIIVILVIHPIGELMAADVTMVTPSAISSLASSSHSNSTSSSSTPSTAIIDCATNHSICLSAFDQQCNLSTGKCECPPSSPIMLSSQIPCLKARALGEMCMHSRECSLAAHSVCIASILFPIELLTVPNYRQWYIYNQISKSNELNYILHKVYGRCRCRAGYRANKHRQCSPLNRESPVPCEHTEDCRAQYLNNSACNIQQGRCHCDSQFFYDAVEEKCRRVVIEFGQFCVTSSDCQQSETKLECHNQRCLCPVDHTYRFGQSCQPNCDLRHQQHTRNGTVYCLPSATSTTPATSSLSLSTFHSLMLKLLPILLIKLFVCNLIRFACYASARYSANDDEEDEEEEEEDETLGGHVRGRTLLPGGRCEVLGPDGRTRSMLSLPPYEAIVNDDYHIQLEERLPSYNEVMMQPKEVNNGGEIIPTISPPPPPPTSITSLQQVEVIANNKLADNGNGSAHPLDESISLV